MAKKNADNIKSLAFETSDLRNRLKSYLDEEFHSIINPNTNKTYKIGDFKWGVYAFFDYEAEPIYVGQTNEKIRTRIGRHLTNQRTDAVAMSVLDPFEVHEIEVWPLPELQTISKPRSRSDPRWRAWEEAVDQLNALEQKIYRKAIDESKFKAVLNEKDPPHTETDIDVPPSLRGRVVSDDVYKIKSHPDTRIARRAQTISRLAQVIAERKVQGGLRRALLTQAKRIQSLAEHRYLETGGAASVETEREGGTDE